MTRTERGPDRNETSPPGGIRPSPEDSARFGIPIARALVTAGTVDRILQEARSTGIRMLIARCDARDLGTVQALEESGGRIMDTLSYWRADTGRIQLPPERPASIRELRDEDVERASAISEVAFRGYPSHYHADPRLDRAACDAVYPDWTRRLCRERGDDRITLVMEHEGEIIAWMHHRAEPDGGRPVLGATDPLHQGRGSYRTLVLEGVRWYAAREPRSWHIDTQIVNVAVQKVWARMGLVPERYDYTFHVWFDERR